MEKRGKLSPRRTAAQWHNIVEAQLASGLSAPRFCKEKHVSYPSFINWKKKLSDKLITSREQKPQFIELTPAPAVIDSAVRNTDATQPLLVELDLGSGIQLRVSRAI